MNKKEITCDLLREKHEVLSQQQEICSRLLVMKGPLSGEFVEVFRVFEERRKELEGLLEEYRHFLRTEWIERFQKIEITRECDSVEAYRKKLEDERYRIGRYAGSMLDAITIRKTDEKNLTLIRVRPKDLGLTGSNTTHNEILTAAKQKGLKPCPPWVGPQYRLDCGDDEFTTIGMEPVPRASGAPSMFYVSGNRYYRELIGTGTRASYNTDFHLVFVVPE